MKEKLEGKIEYTDCIWNPITDHIHKHLVEFHPKRLDEPKLIKEPSRILVAPMGDLFKKSIPDKWINQVLKAVKECPQHTFLFLTQNPNRYYSFDFPSNAWLGAVVKNKPEEEVIPMGKGFLVTDAHTIADTMSFFDRSFLLIDPLLSDVSRDIDLSSIDWVIIGAEGDAKPKREWVESLIDMAKAYDVPIFLRDNLEWSETIQECPFKG